MDPADIAREALEEIKRDANALILECVAAGISYSGAQSIRFKAERAINRLDRQQATLRLGRAA